MTEISLEIDGPEDPFIREICLLDNVAVAREMYERATEREELLPWKGSWDELDEDEQETRCVFVVECFNAAINQYRCSN